MNTKSPEQVALALANLAVRLQAEADPESTLRTIVAAASDIVPAISWAGVSRVSGKIVTPSSATDHVARALDHLQTDLGEGPTIDALHNQRTVVVADLTAETRWPRFVAAAAKQGVHCMASFRLFVHHGTLGALTLYGPKPNMFDDDTVFYGELLAQHAAVAVAGAQAEEQLKRAVASRDLIGQAKGVIMERFRVDAVRAFELLTQLSRESNTKLTEIARQVTETTEASGTPTP